MKRLLTGMSLRVDLSPRRRVLPSGLEALRAGSGAGGRGSYSPSPDRGSIVLYRVTLKLGIWGRREYGP